MGGVPSSISHLTATLSRFSGDADDLNVLLVGPKGRSVMLMAFRVQAEHQQRHLADVRRQRGGAAAREQQLQRDGDVQAEQLRPEPRSPLSPPAPPLPYGSQLSAFNGTDPNGTWSLFLENVGGAGPAGLEAGWSLDMELNPQAPPGGGDTTTKKKCPKGKKLKTVKKNGKKKKKCVKKKKKGKK